MIEAFAAVSIGIALAATCGLRAFLPLFCAGLAAWLGWLPLSGSFQWLGEPSGLVALGVAVVLELAADKVPALDHSLDVLGVPLRTAAGVVVAAAVVAPVPPWASALCAVVGGGAALSIHLTKSFVRLGSTAATAGVANPVISVFEDVLCLGAAVASILVWVLAACVAIVALSWLCFGFRRIWRLRRKGVKDDPGREVHACPRR